MIEAMRFVICTVLAVVFLAGHSKCEQSTAPPQLYVSKGACPFECCTYRRWIANRTVALMDSFTRTARKYRRKISYPARFS
jgi:hypothetical protein